MSSPEPTAAEAPRGERLGPYRLIRELGSGGMGTVHLAEVAEPAANGADEGAANRPPPGTLVAVKRFHPHLVQSAEFLRRFRREARAGASIRHPNVVRTYEAGTARWNGSETSWLAMEYVEGQTLRELIAELSQVPAQLATGIARQVAEGIRAIHAAGVTHRDLKPENVILTHDHHVKLMDLGVAKLREASIRLSMTGQFLGSVHYASPEQFQNPETVDARTDLYALGVLLYEMLAGENPFFHSDLRVVLKRTVTETPRRLGLVVPDVPPVLDELVATLVRKDPAQRLQTAAEVVEVLELGEDSPWWTSQGRAQWADAGGRIARRLSVPRETRLVGREEELAELRRIFDLAAAGERQVVLVEGEAGIGKTRLLDEFSVSLASEGVPLRFLHGTAIAAGAARPLHAFAEALLSALEPKDVEGSLARLLPAESHARQFAAFLRGEPAGESLTVEQVRAHFAAAFRALAAETPLLLVLDDLHLAGEQSVHVLAYLAKDDPSTRMLVAAAFRPPEEGHALSRFLHEHRDPRIHLLPLRRLQPKEVGTLLREVLRNEHAVQELGFRVLEKTEGNPFFVLEVVRSLQQDRTLTRRDDGVWTLMGTKVEIHVPDTVRELVQAGLARLSEADRELLDVASVLGMEFDPEVLAEIVGTPRIALLKRLSQLERRERLIHSVGRRCRFDHHQLQETLYGGLMEGLREEYHAQVGECLERRVAAQRAAPEGEGAAAFEIARHLTLGGRAEAASRWIVAAVRHAAQTYRAEEGAALATRYLDLADATRAVVPPETRVDVLIALVGFHEHEGRREEGRIGLDRAAAESQKIADERLRRRVRDLRLVFHFQVGDFAAAAEACLEAHRDAVRAGDRDGALAALGNLAVAERSRGRYDEAATHLERAIAEFLPETSRLRRCLLLGSLGLVEYHRGRTRSAQRRLVEAMGVAEPFGIGPATGFAAAAAAAEDPLREQFLGLSRALGRSAESRIDGERMLFLETALPRRLCEAAALLVLGVLAGHLGMHADAQRCLLSALAASREGRDARFEAAVLHALGENAMIARDPAAAEARFTEALELRRRIGYRPGVCESLLALGQLAAVGGAVESARAYLDEATELAPVLRLPAIAALARATAALLHAREGRRDLAREDLRHAQEALAAAGPLTVASRTEGLYFAALAARALGDEESYASHMKRAWTLVCEIADRLPPAQRAGFLTATSPNREIAAAVGDAAE